MKKNSVRFFWILVLFQLLTFSCSDNGTNGTRFDLNTIIHSNEFDLDEIDENTEVEIYDNWVIIYFSNKKKVIVNRDKIWAIGVGEEINK